MADTNKIYNRLTQWKLGDPITPTELQKISDSLQAVSQQFGNLIGEQQWNALQENNGLQTVLNDLIMFGDNVQDTSKYTKLFIEAQPTVVYEIPTLDDLNSIIGAKKYIVGNTYEVNDYITYKGSLYKVLNLIENAPERFPSENCANTNMINLLRTKVHIDLDQSDLQNIFPIEQYYTSINHFKNPEPNISNVTKIDNNGEIIYQIDLTNMKSTDVFTVQENLNPTKKYKLFFEAKWQQAPGKTATAGTSNVYVRFSNDAYIYTYTYKENGITKTIIDLQNQAYTNDSGKIVIDIQGNPTVVTPSMSAGVQAQKALYTPDPIPSSRQTEFIKYTVECNQIGADRIRINPNSNNRPSVLYFKNFMLVQEQDFSKIKTDGNGNVDYVPVNINTTAVDDAARAITEVIKPLTGTIEANNNLFNNQIFTDAGIPQNGLSEFYATPHTFSQNFGRNTYKTLYNNLDKNKDYTVSFIAYCDPSTVDNKPGNQFRVRAVKPATYVSGSKDPVEEFSYSFMSDTTYLSDILEENKIDDMINIQEYPDSALVSCTPQDNDILLTAHSYFKTTTITINRGDNLSTIIYLHYVLGTMPNETKNDSYNKTGKYAICVNGVTKNSDDTPNEVKRQEAITPHLYVFQVPKVSDDKIGAKAIVIDENSTKDGQVWHIKNFMIQEGLFNLNQINYQPVGNTLIDKVARGKIDNLQIKVNTPPDYEDINWRYNERKDMLAQLFSKHLFLLYTDIHGAENRLSRINEWYENNYPNKLSDVYCLGDMVGDHFYNEQFDGNRNYEDDITQFEKIPIWNKTLKVIGNHDVLFTNGASQVSGQRATVENILSQNNFKPEGATRFVHYNAQACRKKYLGVDDEKNYFANSYGITFGTQNNGNCCYYFKDYGSPGSETGKLTLKFNIGQYTYELYQQQTLVQKGKYSRKINASGKKILTLTEIKTVVDPDTLEENDIEGTSNDSSRYSASSTFTFLLQASDSVEEKFYLPEQTLFGDILEGQIGTQTDTLSSENTGGNGAAEDVLAEYRGTRKISTNQLRVIVLDDFHYSYDTENLDWEYDQNEDYSNFVKPTSQHEWFRWCLYDALQQGRHVLIMQHSSPLNQLEPLNEQYPFSTKNPQSPKKNNGTQEKNYYSRLQSLNECLAINESDSKNYNQNLYEWLNGWLVNYIDHYEENNDNEPLPANIKDWGNDGSQQWKLYVKTDYNPSEMEIYHYDSKILINKRQLVSDFIQAGGNFVGWVTGHTHHDLTGWYTVSGTKTHTETNNQQTIEVPNYNHKQVVIILSNAGGSPFSTERVGGYSEDCFTYLAVDTQNNYLYLLRIGQAVDLWGHQNLFLCYDYANHEVISYK